MRDEAVRFVEDRSIAKRRLELPLLCRVLVAEKSGGVWNITLPLVPETALPAGLSFRPSPGNMGLSDKRLPDSIVIVRLRQAMAEIKVLSHFLRLPLVCACGRTISPQPQGSSSQLPPGDERRSRRSPKHHRPRMGASASALPSCSRRKQAYRLRGQRERGHTRYGDPGDTIHVACIPIAGIRTEGPDPDFEAVDRRHWPPPHRFGADVRLGHLRPPIWKSASDASCRLSKRYQLTLSRPFTKVPGIQ